MHRHIRRVLFKPPNPKYLRHCCVARFIQTSTEQCKQKDDFKVPLAKPCPNTGSGRGFYQTLGAIIIGTSAVVALAKYDHEFREWLKENVPGSDEFVSFVTAEETTHVDYVMRLIKSWKVPTHEKNGDKDAEKTPLRQVVGMIQKAVVWMKAKIAEIIDDEPLDKKHKSNKPPCDEDGKLYDPKEAVKKRMEELVKDKKREAEERKEELRELQEAEKLSRTHEENETTSDTQEETTQKPTREKATIKKDLHEELKHAISNYADGACILRKYIDTVKEVVENSVEKQDPKIWPSLQTITAKTYEDIMNKFDKAAKAEGDVHKLYRELSDPRQGGLKEEENKAIQESFRSLRNAKEEFIRERNMANVTNTYWTLVKQAREHFQEHLTILFPDLSTTNKSMKLAEAEMDLFILYAFQTILHYQKELNKLDQASKVYLKTALEKSKIGDPDSIECVIEQELEKEKQKICGEYKKKLQDLKSDCEKKANEAIKTHNAKHTSMLQDALARKEQDVMKKMKRQLMEQLVLEKAKYREEMAGLLGRLKGMEELMIERARQEKVAVQAQLLWSACEGLVSAITCERDCSRVTMRALENEIKAVQLAASKDDELVQAVVASIPRIASERGIFGEPALKERFTNTARVARRVALLPEGGASLPLMLISYLQSFLVVSPSIPYPCHELAAKSVNPQTLNTFEILQLSKFWMDRGDWYQVLRYMNQLKGASRVVAEDFLEEVKIFLETKQAAEVLIRHAASSALIT